MRAVPAVQFVLQALALGEQCAVLRRQLMDERGKALPERIGCYARAGQRFCFDEAGKPFVDLKSVVFDHFASFLRRLIL
jgi:hypothetical protein